MDSIRVKYVGKKPFAVDNVAGSRKIWNGNGDVQDVTPAQAKTLCKFKDQWALADPSAIVFLELKSIVEVKDVDGDTVPVDTDSLNKPIEKMSKAELIAYAKDKLGKDIDPATGKKTMIDMIEEWIAEQGADDPGR